MFRIQMFGAMNEPTGGTKAAGVPCSALIALVALILSLVVLLAFKGANEEGYRLGNIEKDDWVASDALVDIGLWCAVTCLVLVALGSAFLSIRRKRGFLEKEPAMQPPERDDG